MLAFLRRPGVPMLVMLGVILYAGCSDPEDDEIITPKPEEEQKEISQEDANSILERFVFSAGTRVSGSVPTVSNTSLIKTNSKDTIYTVPGLKLPIRISHPSTTKIQGWYIAVKNSTSYVDVLIDDEEDSDTVSVVLMEFDPEDIELPLDIPVEITPYDGSKSPIDIIERIITVEEPAAGCDILIDGDTTDANPLPTWLWHSTTVYGANEEIKFINSPFRVFASNQEPTGCCSPACPELKKDPSTGMFKYEYDTKLNVQTSYSILSEVFNFYKNGTFRRYTLEHIRNFNALETDWCSGVPKINDRYSNVYYFGTHDYVPGNTSISYATTRSQCEDPLGICGYGSRSGSLTQSCHLMIITVGSSEGGGSKEERVYVKYTDLDNWEE